MKNLTPVGLPSLALAEGATAPDPGFPAVVWSTTTGSVMRWNGASWGSIGTGPAGAQGVPGPSAPGLALDALPGRQLLPSVSSQSINRHHLAPDARQWTFLGTTSGTGVTVGPIIWTGQYQQLFFEYVIGGHNGGTPVGRLLCGAASISTTAATNGNKLISDVTANATSVSVPGVPLAVTLSNIARSGCGYLYGASGALKQIVINGMSGNPAVATSPTAFEARSFFSDLGTNLPIQRMQLTVYDTLVSTAVSAQTFTATTQLWVWGRNND